MNLQDKICHFKLEIQNIPDTVYNAEQKQIAYSILENANENNIDTIYTFITQRVKLGFTFDAAPEVNHNCVSLIKRNDKLSFGISDNPHKFIIGENYNALKNLLATYTKNGKGLIDVIYIDPPYNTEAAKGDGNDHKENVEAHKFVYRDKFTRNGWLNMMRERLVMARKLLSDTGVIFISIDDTEQAYLKVLCDEIFGEDNFVANFVIDKTAQGANQSNTFKTQHEYLLMYKKLQDSHINFEIEAENNDKFKYKDNKGYYAITNSFDSINSPLQDNKNRGYTVYYNEKTMQALVKDEYDRENNVFLDADINLINQGYTPIRPGIRNGIQYPWNWKKERFLEEYEQELIFQRNKKGDLSIYHKNRSSGFVKDTTLKKFDTRQDGNKCLLNIMGEKCFDYPKSVSMLKWVISKHFNKNATVLDFFAGSGTTGQAVMELNAEDGGNRKCILVSNNENNIAKSITYERLYRVVNGVGTHGEKFDWKYSAEKSYLSNNAWDIFELEDTELKIDDFDKAKKLLDVAHIQFKLLNPEYTPKDFDIYNQLASLNPYKE